MLLGYHLLWSTTANVVGTSEQADRIQKLIIENNYFIGGAVNPRDSDLSIKSDGENVVFSGFKHFNTGGVISDLTVLEGIYEGTEHHIFAFVKTNQPGIQFSHDWNNIGLRLTESGSVKINNVAARSMCWDGMSRIRSQIPQFFRFRLHHYFYPQFSWSSAISILGSRLVHKSMLQSTL
jgi:alkylation response protein AidB-like acyl-CoA dehydrogenase